MNLDESELQEIKVLEITDDSQHFPIPTNQNEISQVLAFCKSTLPSKDDHINNTGINEQEIVIKSKSLTPKILKKIIVLPNKYEYCKWQRIVSAITYVIAVTITCLFAFWLSQISLINIEDISIFVMFLIISTITLKCANVIFLKQTKPYALITLYGSYSSVVFHFFVYVFTISMYLNLNSVDRH